MQSLTLWPLAFSGLCFIDQGVGGILEASIWATNHGSVIDEKAPMEQQEVSLLMDFIKNNLCSFLTVVGLMTIIHGNYNNQSPSLESPLTCQCSETCTPNVTQGVLDEVVKVPNCRN